jgi:outer membrane lipoprotein-sorting protein
MRFLSLFLCLALLAAPAFAADSKQPRTAKTAPKKAVEAPLSEKDLADVQKAEDYLNSLKAARARFVQTTHDGTQLVGTFYLQRPGKLRFEYDPPVEDFVVADGTFIYFYDAELQEQSNAPIGQTLADFILRPKLELQGDLQVISLKRSGDLLQMEVVQSADPAAGKLVLGFKEDPFSLKKWRVIDAQGLITEVELFYLKTDITHTSGLFVYKDPKPKKLND